MKRFDLWLAAALVLICFMWFALYEVYYDGGPMPILPALGGLFVTFLPMFTVYLVREGMRYSRWRFIWAWIWAFVACCIIIAANILVEHYKPNCDRCHIEIEWDFILLIPFAFVYTGVVNGIDSVVARIIHGWKWCMTNRHNVLRFVARLTLTSTVSLLLMRILYEIVGVLRRR